MAVGRVYLLLACAGAGVAIGVAGHAVLGSELGYLAVPALVALGWIFVADPTACDSAPERTRNSGPTDHSSA